MSKKISRKAMVAIVAIIAVIAVVGSSLAWFVTQSSMSQKYSISGINASADVSFAGNGSSIGAEKYKDSDGLYLLSLDPSAENYIGKLRVTVNRSGSKCCLRVKTVLSGHLPMERFHSIRFSSRTASMRLGTIIEARITAFTIVARIFRAK